MEEATPATPAASVANPEPVIRVGPRDFTLEYGASQLLDIESALAEAYPGPRPHSALRTFLDFLAGVERLDVPERVLFILLKEGLKKHHPTIRDPEVLSIREEAGMVACITAVTGAALRSPLGIRKNAPASA